MTYVTLTTVHQLCGALIDQATASAGNAWRLSKLLGINHCTLVNFKKHPNRVLNGRHFIALIRYLGPEKSIQTITSYGPCSVGEFMEEKQQLAKRIKNRKGTSNDGSIKLKTIYANQESDCGT